MAKFLLSRLMPTALDVAEHIVSAKEFLNSSTATICVDISNLLVVISSATNFFIYFAFSRSFRRVVCPRFMSLCCVKETLHERRQRRNLPIRQTRSSDSSAPSHLLTTMNNCTRIRTPLLAIDLPTPRIEVLI
uniref:G_PROTEIN_RECEP_F1_2 domain-containing protein n=1 Tax=Ascaris lumbricoides TaxID=6252 RepID=A0A0M3IMD1_ASCLU